MCLNLPVYFKKKDTDFHGSPQVLIREIRGNPCPISFFLDSHRDSSFRVPNIVFCHKRVPQSDWFGLELERRPRRNLIAEGRSGRRSAQSARVSRQESQRWKKSRFSPIFGPQVLLAGSRSRSMLLSKPSQRRSPAQIFWRPLRWRRSSRTTLRGGWVLAACLMARLTQGETCTWYAPMIRRPL